MLPSCEAGNGEAYRQPASRDARPQQRSTRRVRVTAVRWAWLQPSDHLAALDALAGLLDEDPVDPEPALAVEEPSP